MQSQKKAFEVMDMLTILIVVMASQGMMMSKLRRLHTKYVQLLYVTYAILHIICNTYNY